MAGGIDHQSAPRETRLVLNRDRWCGKSAGRNIHQLKKSLEPVHRSEWRWCGEFCARGGHIENVALVLAEFLNFLARVIGLNHERCFCRLGRFEGERETRLAHELPQESLASTFQPRLSMAGERHRKRRVQSQASRPGPRARGKRYEIQCRLLSCGHHRVQQNAKKK